MTTSYSHFCSLNGRLGATAKGGPVDERDSHELNIPQLTKAQVISMQIANATMHAFVAPCVRAPIRSVVSLALPLARFWTLRE